MKNYIIGIAGEIGSGKDTLASMINYIVAIGTTSAKYEDWLINKTKYDIKYAERITHFADPLKDCLSIMFSIKREYFDSREHKDNLWYVIKGKQFITEHDARSADYVKVTIEDLKKLPETIEGERGKKAYEIYDQIDWNDQQSVIDGVSKISETINAKYVPNERLIEYLNTKKKIIGSEDVWSKDYIGRWIATTTKDFAQPKVEGRIDVKDVEVIIPTKEGGKVIVKYKGKEVPFEQFGLLIDNDTKEAFIGKVQKTDQDGLKGIGTAAYIKLGEQLAKKGITLSASGALLGKGHALWMRLAKEGYAKKQGGGFVFTSKEISAPTAAAKPVETVEKQAEVEKVVSQKEDELATEEPRVTEIETIKNKQNGINETTEKVQERTELLGEKPEVKTEQTGSEKGEADKADEVATDTKIKPVLPLSPESGVVVPQKEKVAEKGENKIEILESEATDGNKLSAAAPPPFTGFIKNTLSDPVSAAVCHTLLPKAFQKSSPLETSNAVF